MKRKMRKKPEKKSKMIADKEVKEERDIESFKTDVRNILQPSNDDTNRKTIDTNEKAVKTEVEKELSENLGQNYSEGSTLTLTATQAEPTDNKEEVTAAVGILMSLEEDAGGAGGLQEKEDKDLRKCVFGCDERFSTEDEFFIHITDYHNDF